MVCKWNTRSEFSKQPSWFIREQDRYMQSDVAGGASENRPTRLGMLTDINTDV
jgi:hypothetical protein